MKRYHGAFLKLFAAGVLVCAQVCATPSWTTNGTVSAAIDSGGRTYVAGAFTWAGPAGGTMETGKDCENLAAVDPVTGAALDWFPGVSGPVTALAFSADGATLYAGGERFVDAVDVVSGASSLLTSVQGTVTALAVSGKILLIGGDFLSDAGDHRYLEAFDLENCAPAHWTPPSLSGPVTALSVSGNTLRVSTDSPVSGDVQLGLPYVTLTTPNGGELWAPGSTHAILWTSVGLSDNVIIRLWDNLTTYTNLAEVPISNGSYAWTVPDTPGTKFRIQIISKESSLYTDWSDANFSIASDAPSITVTSPNGGELYAAGSTQSITWTSTGLTGNVRIRLWDNCSTYTVLAEVPIADGSYSWTVPGTTGNKFRVQLISRMNSAYADWSDANFAIGSATPSITVGYPNGDEVWTPGTVQTIRWSYTALSPSETVTLRLANTKAQPWFWVVEPIAVVPITDGEYEWTVPAVADSEYRIQAVVSGSMADWSDENFVIGTKYIRVTSLNSGEMLAPGSTQNITWIYQGLKGDVRIRLWDRYDTYTDLALVPITDQTFTWTVPSTEGCNWDIQIIVRKNSAYADWTDQQFSIGTAPPSVTVLSPNGGETLTAGTTQSITWDSATLSGDVIIRLWDGLNTYTDVDVVPIYDGSYAWTVPNTPGANFRLQLISGVGSTYADWSDSVFAITSP